MEKNKKSAARLKKVPSVLGEALGVCVLQCVAVCCSVLQCAVPAFCSVLQCVAVCCSVLQCAVPAFCSVLQCVAVCCSVLSQRAGRSA